jgi:hypothetical protein
MIESMIVKDANSNISALFKLSICTYVVMVKGPSWFWVPYLMGSVKVLLEHRHG